MDKRKRSSKRSRRTGGKVVGGAAVLALLLAGGQCGLGIGREGGGLLTRENIDTVTQVMTETFQNVVSTAAPTAAPTAEPTAEPTQQPVTEIVVPQPQDDGVLTITVQEDRLLYEGQAVTLAQLEQFLLNDYKADAFTVELKDDHAIKAAYDEVTALLQRLNIPFTQGK